MKIRYISKSLSSFDIIVVATENRWQTYPTIEFVELFASSTIEDKIAMFEKSDRDIKQKLISFISDNEFQSYLKVSKL